MESAMLCVTPAAKLNPYTAIAKVQAPQDKPYERMTKAQKRWYDVMKRRQVDQDWSLAGMDWETMKWELHYLAGYTWLPGKEIAGFVHGGIDLLKSVGLVVVNHFWHPNHNRAQEGDVGTAVRLYKITFDEKSGEIVYGHNGQEGDQDTSSCLAKNLSLMPYAGAHGAIIDAEKTPALLETALLIEEKLMLCATEPGRQLLEDPSFPSCLLGFRNGKEPSGDDADLGLLCNTAIDYLLATSDNGRFNNGDLLDALKTGDKPLSIAAIRYANEQLILDTSEGEIALPQAVTLRPNVSVGATVPPRTAIGDILLPLEVVRVSDWEDVEEALGSYAADWLLMAVYNQSLITHRFMDNDLVCVPHVLHPEEKPEVRFLDMRAFLGREYRDPADPFNVARIAKDEAKITCFHMHQPACAEAMQFQGTGYRADLWTVRPYWDKHFKSGRIPQTKEGKPKHLLAKAG
jgi:hypothetical protein